MLKYLPREEDYIPWAAASSGLNFLSARFEGSENAKYLNTVLGNLLENRYKSLGFSPKPESDQHLDILGRSTASGWMCSLNNTDCVSNSMKAYQEWMENDTPIPADIKDVVYKTAIRKGNSTHWDFMYKKFQEVTIDSERQKYIYSLGTSEDKVILEKYLNMTMNRDESGIRLQDCIYVFRTVSVNRVGRYVIMDWMDKYYKEISTAFGDPGSNAGGGQGFANFAATILGGFASTSNTLTEIAVINTFVENHQADLQGEMTKITDLLKTADLNVAWNRDNSGEVVDWLKKELNEDDNGGDENAASTLTSATTLVAFVAFALNSII